jgi:hypothetical protein
MKSLSDVLPVGQRKDAMTSKVRLVLFLVLYSGISCGDCEQSVQARPYVVDSKCFGEPRLVGCLQAGRSCPPNIKFAADESGRCFAFLDCLPEGFAQAEKCEPTDGYRDCPAVKAALPTQALQLDGRVGRCAPSRVRR